MPRAKRTVINSGQLVAVGSGDLVSLREATKGAARSNFTAALQRLSLYEDLDGEKSNHPDKVYLAYTNKLNAKMQLNDTRAEALLLKSQHRDLWGTFSLIWVAAIEQSVADYINFAIDNHHSRVLIKKGIDDVISVVSSCCHTVFVTHFQ